MVVWRDQAEHAAESLSKGSRVVVVGRLQQRSWTAEDGSVTLRTVECLGGCGWATVVALDNHHRLGVRAGDVPGIAKELRGSA